MVRFIDNIIILPLATQSNVVHVFLHLQTLKLLFSCSHYTSGFDGNIDSQGELILQESFQVWDPKTLIRKGRDRHLFLFEMSLVFSKEVKDSNGRSKYLYKSKLFVSLWIWLYCSFLPISYNSWRLKLTGGVYRRC